MKRELHGTFEDITRSNFLRNRCIPWHIFPFTNHSFIFRRLWNTFWKTSATNYKANSLNFIVVVSQTTLYNRSLLVSRGNKKDARRAEGTSRTHFILRRPFTTNESTRFNRARPDMPAVHFAFFSWNMQRNQCSSGCALLLAHLADHGNSMVPGDKTCPRHQLPPLAWPMSFLLMKLSVTRTTCSFSFFLLRSVSLCLYPFSSFSPLFFCLRALFTSHLRFFFEE